MNKFFILSLIISSLFVQNLWAKKGDPADRKKHADYYAKYDKHLNEQIDNLPPLTGCDNIDPDLKNPNGEYALASCVKQQLEKTDDTVLLEIEDILELKTHNLIKSKKKKEIVGFLGDKFEDRLHQNKKTKRTRKDKKFIDERQYFTLYKNQLANNVLLDVASFCKERVYIDNNCFDSGNKKPKNCNIKIGTDQKNNFQTDFQTNGTGPDYKNKPLAVQRYEYCRNNIQSICEETTIKNHHEACLLKERLIKTEKALKVTRNIETNYKKNHYTNQGHAFNSSGYAGQLSDQNLEEVAAITSDLAHDDNAKNESENLKEELKKECIDGDKTSVECKQFFSVLTEKDLEDIKRKVVTKYGIAGAKLDSLLDKNDEQSNDKIKEIAAKYVDIDKAGLKDDIKAIKDALDKELKLQQEAIIKSITAKVARDITKEEEIEIAVDSTKIASKEKEIQKTKANALRDNIFYSNMVNSYLGRSTQGGETSQNTQFRERELRAAQGINADPSDSYTNNLKTAQAYFEQNSSSQDSSSANTDGAIDGLETIFNIVIRGKFPDQNKKK